MRHRLTKRLLIYFSLTLLLFAVLCGSVFAWLFMRYNQQVYETELRQRAETLAAIIPSLSDSQSLLASPDSEGTSMSEEPGTLQPWPHHMMGHGRGRHMGQRGWCRQQYSVNAAEPEDANQPGRFLQQLDQMMQGKVWLVTAQNHMIYAYGEKSGREDGELPPEVEAVLQQVLAGHTAVSRDFGALVDTPSLTVGAPLIGQDGNVIGAVLIHRPLQEMRQTLSDGLQLLGLSVLLGLLLAGGLAILLTRRFIDPLYRMQSVSRSFAQGQYEERTGISQQDEIGMLASDIDMLGSRLEAARQERERLTRQRQDFLSAISHELRTPLTVLRGTVELLASGLVQGDAERSKYSRQMMANLSALERLVGDLLELSRLQNPGFTMEMVPLDFREAVQEAAANIRSLATARMIAVEVELPEPLPMEGDYGRLRQLVMILMDNAVKFSSAGQRVEVYGWRKQEEWQVTVEDHGCGIAAEELPYIFERFHGSRENNEQGTGMGLAIAQEIAHRHGINISCESEPGAGTKFILSGRLLAETV
ncbi:Signal transduction histidine kinase [Selenomonas sp. GACV-9]|uniref:sensor histidine kinase n=1 Tax=Selenomonas sp. GACV-9 TaxID=3158782 RepID=UPI0008F0D56E|nr:Signal transduction histidine kinase [Selenomonas ruminantium]